MARAATWCTDALHAEGGDWNAPIPGLEWTVRQAVAHAAEACLWYAIDLSAGATELTTVEQRVKPDGEPAALVSTLTTCASMVVSVLRSVPPTQRGYHPFGVADPSGFAAMACDELLIHTDDALRGLGHVVAPPEDLCALTVRRLFPWVPDVGDPWVELRWANGRIDLPDRPSSNMWQWHCAPLAEWDGINPNASSV